MRSRREFPVPLPVLVSLHLAQQATGPASGPSRSHRRELVRAFGRMRFLSHFLLSDIAASQMVEFAVCLPLLIVVVVGIFDFGEAFNVKQKLNGAAREGARFASSLPTNDLSDAGTPASVPRSGIWLRHISPILASIIAGWARKLPQMRPQPGPMHLQATDARAR